MLRKQNALLFILIVAAIKLLLSYFLELGNDEVYYITYARQLQLNYFDHPPFVGLILKFFSADLLLRNEIFLRLGFILCGAVSMWLIIKIGQELHNKITGWIACLLFTASVYANIISGFMIMPDAPMLVFWLWAFYIALKIIKDQNRRPQKLLLFGLAVGLGIMSKVSAALIWVGFGVFILLFKRGLLKSVYLYFSVLITALIASPILFWNLTNQSAGASYHVNRVANLSQLQPQFFLQNLFGEFGYNNPINFVLIIAGIFYCFKKNVFPGNYKVLIICFAMPLIAFVWFSALFNQTLPHWTGPSYTLLLFFAAIFLADKAKAGTKMPSVLYWANGLIVFALLIISFAAHKLSFAFHAKNEKYLGKGDLLLDFSGWKEFSKDFAKLYEADVSNGLMKSGSFIISDYWFPAAHLDWYVAETNKMPFKVIGNINDIHQYAWLNKQRKQLQPGDDAYFIYVSNYYREPDSVLLNQFSTKIPAGEIIQFRNGKAVRKFYITRLKNFKGVISEKTSGRFIKNQTTPDRLTVYSHR